MRGGYQHVLEINLRRFQPEEAKKRHIAIARSVLNQFLSHQRDRPEYKIITDGIESRSEESVRPFGVIRYVFIRMAAVGAYAKKTAQDLSPVQSGKYKKSWLLIADGQLVTEAPNGTQELILVNNQPYARKIQLRGARLRGVPPGIVEKVRQMTIRRFRGVTVDLRFISLPGGYKLQKDYVQIRRSSGRTRVRDRAGTGLTYPALIIKPKFG